jgi:hypothetical protein
MNTMENFRIDPEFQNKIPPIGEDEFKQLRENILAAGEVYEPLVVWNGVLVDGHNRWKVIRENQSIKYTVREMSFPDKWAAFEWMYKNQLGRRNLTDEQRTYTIGKMYEARKNTQGGDRRSEEFSNAHDGHLKPHVVTTDKTSHGVSGEIAVELNIGRNTVRRAEHFAKGVDALREINPNAADKVLSGRAKVTRTAVAGLAKMERDEVEHAADAIMAGMLISATKPSVPKPPAEEPAPAYGIDGLIEIVEVNGKKYVSMLETSIRTRQFVIDGEEAKNRLKDTIAEIIVEIEKVREAL